MSRVLVVSQPMFLPWIGLFEQVRLADVFVHYDDVQLPQGRSFMSRVQMKTASGAHWLTAPLDHAKSGKLLNEIVLFEQEDWRSKHMKTIRHAYAKAPHFDVMFDLVERIYAQPTNLLAEFNMTAIEMVAKWLGISPRFARSSTSGVNGTSTQRLVDLCRREACDVYVTGHGALKYLDHDAFESSGISVRYMSYQKRAYRQMHGEFTPFVSIVDAIANCGVATRELICSDAIGWRDFHVG